jgi:5-methylcytosine-specific restriction protein B
VPKYPGRDSIYGVAELFRTQCLSEGKSLLWPNLNAWNPLTLERLSRAFTEHPDTSDRTFREKWRDQLSGEPDEVHVAAADVTTLYYLFPDNVGQDAKQKNLA